jgi:hypothetical protein
VKAPARWPLAALLALAGRRELAARIGLGEALAEVARRRGEEDAAREALAAHRAAAAAARRAPGADAVVAALGAGARHAARCALEERGLAAALRQREATHDDARAAAEARRGALAEARAAVRALEAGRAAWRAARARDAARAEEDAVDEVVSARWGAAS